jgi:hypothetical protein
MPQGRCFMVGQDFVVSLGDGRFFREIDGRVVTTTAAPSDGAFLTYKEATALVARLRARGFRNALVTDLAGDPATYDKLQEYRRVAAADDLPRTHEDLDRMLVAEFRRRHATEPAFRRRVEDLEKQPRQPKKSGRQNT